MHFPHQKTRGRRGVKVGDTLSPYVPSTDQMWTPLTLRLNSVVTRFSVVSRCFPVRPFLGSDTCPPTVPGVQDLRPDRVTESPKADSLTMWKFRLCKEGRLCDVQTKIRLKSIFDNVSGRTDGKSVLFSEKKKKDPPCKVLFTGKKIHDLRT